MRDIAVIKSEWTDKDWNKVTKWLHSMLQTNIVTITFTKQDGTERVMNCTLDPEVLPPVPVTEGVEKKERKKSDTTMAVYDTDLKGWRSFTIKSLKHISLTI